MLLSPACLRGQTVKHYLDINNEQDAMQGVRRVFEAADAAGMMLFSKVGRLL
jgi:hypothetical protein